MSNQQTASQMLAGIDLEPQLFRKKYVLQDIMKRRRKDQQTVMNKIRNKQQLKNKRKSKKDLIKPPEKFIKEYRAQQKSYSKYRQQSKKVHQGASRIRRTTSSGKLLLAIRIRGVADISKQQRIILSKLGLRQVNTAVFLKATLKNCTMLKTVENYITWGEPNKKIISELIYKKAYGNINNSRVQIKSNELIQKQIGGQILCFEDMINQIANTGKQFKEIKQFIYPFKLTTPEGLLVSRLRKPVSKDGHWGYRGQEINEYVEAMI